MKSALKLPGRSPIWSRIVLLVWVVVLIVWAWDSRTASVNVSVLEMMGRAALVAVLREFVLSAVANFVLYLPLGYLVALSMRPTAAQPSAHRRWALTIALSFLLATSIVVIQRGSPLVLDLLLPWLACLVGCWGAMAWMGGSTARLRFVKQFSLLTVMLWAGLLFAVLLALDSTPLALGQKPITSDEKRLLYGKVSGKNPKKLLPGEIVELHFSTDELNSILAWGSTVVTSVRAARIQLTNSHAELSASTAVPRTARYLNVTLDGGLHLAEGHFDAWVERARIGRLEVPRAILGAVLPAINRLANQDERSKQFLQLLKSVELESGQLTVRYGHSDPPKGLIARLFQDPGSAATDTAAIRAQLMNLIAAVPNLPTEGDARLSAAVQTAFRYAFDHALPEQAITQNRTALLALGIALGHPRIQSLTGPVLDETTIGVLSRAFEQTTLRSRADWTKHFFVSAALTVVAAQDVSNATGLFKEEKDADGGSGFSFGDLLADRSGTTFAEFATRSEASARSLQEKLVQGFKVDDYFPEGKDLPENIQDAELKARYGGVGGVEYGRWINEIERRIAACAAYRQ